jgi:hypothetical protein
MTKHLLSRALLPVILVVATCGLGASPANAQAQGLAAVGPLDPGNGYPQYFQDKTGLALEQCLDNTTAGDLCGVAVSDIPNPLAPVVFPDNFPSEFFYQLVSARITIPPGAAPPPTGGGGKGGGGGGTGGGRLDLTMALEGAFGGPGLVASNQQIGFARFRVRVTGGLVPGASYRVTYPYGVKTFVASSTGTINFTDDQGCGLAPCDFEALLSSTNVGPFLRWDSTAPAAPAGFLGDPNVNHPITGSPFGTNFVRIEGPNVGGTNINSLQTNLFAVTGKIFDGVIATPLTADRTTYSRSAGLSTEVDLFVHSAGNASVVATAGGIPTTNLAGDPATGRFYAGLFLAPGSPLPAFVRYTAQSVGDDPTVLDSPLVDEVKVTTATYSIGGGVLTVTASSSDQVAMPTLTASGSPFEQIGTLTGGILVTPLAVPPFQIIVTSSNGGAGSLPVDLVP